MCVVRWFAELKGPWESRERGARESRVKGVFGLRGSLGVCKESESPFGGHVGRRGPQRRNTRTAQGGAASCLACCV